MGEVPVGVLSCRLIKENCSVSKNAPTLASCSFDKHGLILIIFGKQHQHTFINNMRVQFLLCLYFYLLYLHLNSCDGNDAFWRHCMFGKQSTPLAENTVLYLSISVSAKQSGWLQNLWTDAGTCVHCTNTRSWHQPLWPATWSSTSLTHGQAYHKTSSTKQLVNAESTFNCNDVQWVHSTTRSTTNTNHLDHWSTAPLISSRLIMTHLTVQALFQLANVIGLLTIYHVLKIVPNCIVHFLAGNTTIILSTVQPFSILLTVDHQQSDVPCRYDVWARPPHTTLFMSQL